MHGICFDYPLQDWFEFKVPRTKVSDDYIYNVLHEDDMFTVKPTAKVVWIGGKPIVSYFTKNKKGRTFETASLTFHDKKESYSIQVNREQGEWLVKLLNQITANPENKVMGFQQVKQSYEADGMDDFELFWYSKPVNTLREYGLLIL